MVRDPAGDFDHPSVPEGSPLRRHVLYRIGTSQYQPPYGGLSERQAQDGSVWMTDDGGTTGDGR